MTPRAVARRYASALFDVARTSGAVERVSSDLAGLRALVDQSDDLRRVFETPAVAPQKKRAIVDAIVSASDGISGEVARLLQLLADRDRLMLLPDLADAFADRVMQEKRIVAAEIVTAVPLPEPSRAALARALGRATGSDVKMTEHVDPSIVGGVIAKVGSVVFDGSVTRHIERLRERLLAERV